MLDSQAQLEILDFTLSDFEQNRDMFDSNYCMVN